MESAAAWSRVRPRLRVVRNVLVQRTKRLRCVAPTASVHVTADVARDLRAEDFAFVGPRCRLDPGVSIGRYSMLAPEVVVTGDDHVWDQPGVPIQFAGRPEQTRTMIHDDVWVGHGALIRRGVTIGRGAVVAARSVVTKDVAPYDVVAGVPARPIAARFPDPAERRLHERMLDGATVAPRFTGRLAAPEPEEKEA